MPLPTLTTPRLSLVPCAMTDVDLLHRLWTDPDVRRYLWDGEAIARELAEDTLRNAVEAAVRERLGLWIVRALGAAAVDPGGFCALLRRDPEDDPELMYGLAPPLWGRGFASEASQAVLAYGFEVLGLERIVAATDPPNLASTRVMERLGMRFLRRGPLNGRDTLFYELRRPDFLKGRTAPR